MQVSNTSATIDRTLDVTGCLCPLPLLKLKLGLKEMLPGQVIELLASDATSTQDIPAFCKLSGHQLVATQQDGDTYIFRVKKVEASA
ncbi:sulfurtransferase TusA family protein [Halioxenophilus aromaticivorans]|uniref:Sulfurtransferase TusA n=1 Tax=Halioxenophilus aromaticivorans TaxID=1306992 RepID=A0AAV3TZB8_9ALTE